MSDSTQLRHPFSSIGCVLTMLAGVVGMGNPGAAQAPPDAGSAASAAVRETRSLDGTWQIIFDADNRGTGELWFKPEIFEKQKSIRSIEVPSCWEETEQDYEGVAWYARQFRAPAAWKGKHVRLRFDAVNYLAEVWLNGEIVGCHQGGYTPFELDASGLIELGKDNFLVVRVVGPAVVSQSVDGLVRDEAPHWRGAYVGGIWQSVGLIATEPVYVSDLFVEPRIDRDAAVVHVAIENAGLASRELSAVVKLLEHGGASKAVARAAEKITAAPGTREFEVELKIPQPVLWSPQQPNLYVAQVDLEAEGKVVDSLAVRFGMRQFTIRDGDFCLNGKRVFIKGAFWEGLYPSTLAHPRDPAIVRQEIRLAKEAGFNLLRPWRMPPVPMTLNLADELGILLVGSPPIECMGHWPAETPQLERRWTSEMQQMVRRDRNHPSIVCWETSNEIVRRSLLLLRHKVSLAARRLDPTRLIIDESGGSRAPWGAHAYLPYSTTPTPILDQHLYLRSPVNDGDYYRLAISGQRGVLTFTSEVGYGGLPDLPRNVASYKNQGNPKTPDYRYHHALLASLEQMMDQHKLRDLFPDASSLCLATQEIQAVGNKLQLEALRLNPLMDGYVLHAFTDGDWVLGAGVLDLWRKPKEAYHAVKEVNQPLYLAIRANPQNVYASKGTALSVTALNESGAVEGELTLSVYDSPRRPAWTARRAVKLTGGTEQLFDQRLSTTKLRGQYTVTARITKGLDTLSANSYGLLVIQPSESKPPGSAVALIEPGEQVREFFESRGVPCQSFNDSRQFTGLVIVAQADALNEQHFKRLVHLMDYVKRGGVAVFLKPPTLQQPPAPTIYDDSDTYLNRLRFGPRRRQMPANAMVQTGLFPLNLHHRAAKGNWIGVYHYVRKHPIFEGLPTGGFMAQPYQNVAPVQTIVDLDAPAIAGCVSWDIVDKNYLGPKAAWHGTDLAVVPHGKGKMILSTLQIIEYLDKDPVADTILLNMASFAAQSIGPLAQPAADLDRQVEQYLARYREFRGKSDSPSR